LNRVVLALAGRRIDAPGRSHPRFPTANVARVAEQVRTLFTALRANGLVCSAACGADLIALDTARDLGMARRVVLPFDPALFRATSVIDRPGDWGERFDRTIDELSPSGDVAVLNYSGADPDAYTATNTAVLDQALAIARTSNRPAAAVIVWDGSPLGTDDASEHFRTEACRRGLPVHEVSTLSEPAGGRP
jgi:hypothetical protein